MVTVGDLGGEMPVRDFFHKLRMLWPGNQIKWFAYGAVFSFFVFSMVGGLSLAAYKDVLHKDPIIIGSVHPPAPPSPPRIAQGRFALEDWVKAGGVSVGSNLSDVDQALMKLPTGSVAFNVPERTRVGKPLIIEAILSTILKPADLALLIKEVGKAEAASLKISNRMVATLSGGSAFDIAATSSADQLISDKDMTSWTWLVTPKTVGEQLMILSLDVVISINGKEDKRTITTFKQRIDVDVGWPQTWGEWLDLLKKTGESVWWIGAAIVTISGVVWGWFTHRARRITPPTLPTVAATATVQNGATEVPSPPPPEVTPAAPTTTASKEPAH